MSHTTVIRDVLVACGSGHLSCCDLSVLPLTSALLTRVLGAGLPGNSSTESGQRGDQASLSCESLPFPKPVRHNISVLLLLQLQ